MFNQSIEKATRIMGWMTEAELWWLAVQASSRKRILELGSYYGRSTRALADNTEGVVYAVDNWNGPPEVNMYDFERKSLKSIFDKNLRDHIESGKVIAVQSDHSEYNPEDMQFDMVFIDGGHEYLDASRDIRRWAGNCPKALICGHDIDHPGVEKAVKEAFGEYHTFGGIWSVWTF